MSQTVEHPLDHAYFRLDWAKKRLAELETINRDFIYKEANFLRNSVRINIDNDSSIPDIFVPSKPDNLIPVSFPILVGEIAQHLRTTLDYLVYRLAILDSGPSQEFTQFPVADTPDKFKIQSKGRLKGVNAAHIAAIETLQPYNGVDWTKRLVAISNRDKHMDLNITVARSAVRLQAGLTPNPPTSSDEEGLSVVIEIPKENQVFRRDWKVAPDQQVYVEFFFALFIVFDNGLHVLKTLERIEAEVRNTLTKFRPEF